MALYVLGGTFETVNEHTVLAHMESNTFTRFPPLPNGNYQIS